MKQIKRYDIDFSNIIYTPDDLAWIESDTGNHCKSEDVEHLEKENGELKKYKKMWNELRDEVQWIGDEMVYNSMIEKEKEN